MQYKILILNGLLLYFSVADSHHFPIVLNWHKLFDKGDREQIIF
ncbi:hypothetical protein yberc0001_22090 [Yersinia bercovieri ATCC 43970]|uniref:Uncharacterized protein n=1 Tax=Yersinia bercovieri ATCC 43970 TaxID=349968 RepID=A0ABM9Y420_YERBE|nr:hypothetical protein [Yersinia sp. Marseille-Q3913]EEQ08467.1 hypothetical protein yberc0001_22090 [Yersinia bercovieri ATCC 43970]